MAEMNNLFETIETINAGNNRGLSGTAQLTQIAGNIAANIISEMNNSIEMYAEDIKSSQTDHNAMDNLINRFGYMAEADVDFLKELDDETIEGMLKSQQSKRSRCKAKAMTLDNYKALMTGAIAENLIRQTTGKEKHAGGTRRLAGSVDYTIEELERLNVDQEALRKEIRNIQSKKSIMKSKAGFSEEDERWIALCKAEQQLKDMRVSTSPARVVKVDETKVALSEMMAGIDINSMKAADSKALLEKIMEMTASAGAMEETEE